MLQHKIDDLENQVAELQAQVASNKKGLALYEHTLKVAKSVVFSISIEENYLWDYISEGCLDILGYSAEDIIGTDVAILLPDFIAILKEAATSLESISILHEIRCSKQNISKINITGDIIVDSNGEPEFFNGVISDASAFAAEINESKIREQKISSMLKILPDDIFVVDLAGFIHIAHIRSINYNSEKLIGKNISTIVPPDLHEKIMYVIPKVMQADKPEIIEYSMEINGESRFFEIRIVGMTEVLVLGVVHEVTNREIAKKYLAENNTLYKTIIDNSMQRIALFSLDGKLLLTNKAFYSALGYTEEEYWQIKTANRTGFKEYLSKIRESLFERRIVETEYQIISKEGIAMHFNTRNILLRDEHGEPSKVLLISNDITNVVNYTNDLLHAKNKAETSNRLKSNFLADMSHEIRTPLNSIVGFAQLLQNDTLSSHEKGQFCDMIKRNSDMLLFLINDIIDISKIEAGQLTIVPENISLNKTLSTLKKNLKTNEVFLQELNIKLIVTMPLSEEEAMVWVDGSRIMQVFNNLVNNAFKFTSDGFIEIGYYATIDSNQSIVCYVKDTGIGIEQDKVERVFGQFLQADSSIHKQYGGTDLGLNICKNLVELMNGKIWVESVHGEGSTFYFTIPLSPESTLYVPKEQSNKHDWSDKHILIVNESYYDIKQIEYALADTGAVINYTFHAYEAAEKLAEPTIHYDLVLVNITKPVMNGYAAAKQILAAAPNGNIVFYSDFDIEDIQDIMKETGVKASIHKSKNKADILNSIALCI